VLFEERSHEGAELRVVFDQQQGVLHRSVVPYVGAAGVGSGRVFTKLKIPHSL
jgi:hypothetical protein